MSHSLLKEKQIVARLKAGEEEAFVWLFEYYSPILTSFLAGLKFDAEDVSDTIQQTFLKVWENRNRIDVDASFKNYVITIAKNDIYNKVKKSISAQKYLDHSVLHSDQSVEITTTELTDILSTILANLPEKRKQVFEMSRIQGYSNKEIAEELGITKSTVENHINNSSSVVKKLLKGLGFGIAALFFLF
ncbi:RNA polymerase sigma factor [Sphingobacterium psychroaquaticum]|uniref:RNA polymerase sigma-70 factor, ECF subfamily n=1 Tax=Sphingobacterium psychroaquaticum TaxID=561061 RepID=A0A1X7IC27_9SPHI|nr:sigma-70 family RNA polymerase sigma factor [Sphingobacterium psychroaquaticum]SMG11765.1 RNA polymerase sigma-70 factor, ECF subfamily [Sphingobacterium psychroaquaticum]